MKSKEFTDRLDKEVSEHGEQSLGACMVIALIVNDGPVSVSAGDLKKDCIVFTFSDGTSVTLDAHYWNEQDYWNSRRD